MFQSYRQVLMLAALGASFLYSSTSSAARPFQVGIAGYFAAASTGMSETRAGLTLTVPFDALAGPRVRRAAIARKTKRRRDRRRAVKLTSKLARLTVRAALRAGATRGPVVPARRARLQGCPHRSPALRLRGGRTTDQNLRYSPTIDDPRRYTQSGGATYYMEARATWRLGKAVFAADEVRIERIRRQHGAARLRVIERALGYLFAWYRAGVRLRAPDLLPEERLAARLDRIEAAARLDVLTDGWFGRHTRR